MDSEKLIDKYWNLSNEEVEKIKKASKFTNFSHISFETRLRHLHDQREREKRHGRSAVVAAPLVHLLSVLLLTDQNKPQLSVSGKIYARVRTVNGKIVSHDLYLRNSDEPELIGPNGALTLTSFDFSSRPFDTCMPFNNTSLVVDIHAGGKNLVAELPCSGEDVTDFGQVNLKYVQDELCSLALRYITLPLGIYGRVQFKFFHKQDGDEEKGHCCLNVKGKIVARYENTYGSYDSEECMLFEKQSNDFEPMNLGSRKSIMGLSRCWVCAPVYSILTLHVDLLEFGTERKILKEVIQFPVNTVSSYEEFIVDDILIGVCVDWFPAKPQGILNNDESGMELDDESSNDEMSSEGYIEEESDDAQMIEPPVSRPSSNLTRTWVLRPHGILPISSSAVQIFSIVVSRENTKALQVFGSIEVSCAACTFNVFKREAREAFGLSQHKKTVPMLDASGVYDDCDSLEMEIDLKDVENFLHIRGYVNWDPRTLEFGTSWLNKQLCSVIQGQNGFVAVHYTIFPEAVQADVHVWYIPKDGHMSIHPKVHGNIVAQYNNYDYTSRYNKDYYRAVLFERNEEDAAQLRPDGVIDLLRPKVVVPLNSSLVIEATLRIGVDQVLSHSIGFEIGSSNYMTMEGSDYSIQAHVKWGEVNPGCSKTHSAC